MKGNFAPYMDIENEYPELKEFFEREKAGKNQPDSVAVNGGHDSGDAKVKVEKSGILTAQNEVVQQIPVTV
jgi:hypothetical protein